jgi:phosphoribosyl 1,2-cyclic phosphodiesterase
MELLKNKERQVFHLFLTHVHWDHIQGFPFFLPAMIKGNSVHIYGLQDAKHNLSDILAGQMEGPNFPISIDMMGADIHFHDIREGVTVPIKYGGTPVAKVKNARLNHPNGALGYRITDIGKGTSAVYATDTEHYRGRLDENLVELSRGVEVLIYDSTYTTEEYYGLKGNKPHCGWGHSTWEEAIKVCAAAKVKNLYLFHHDPTHSDKFLETQILANARQAARKAGCKTKVFLSRELLTLNI